jgi:hypothetical protein
MRVCHAVLVIGLLAMPIGAALGSPCVRPAEHTTFDVAALKSQLMVTALSCDAREKYNAFVLRFRAELMARETALQGWFARTYGRRGEKQHDNYITELANTQSEAGLRKGAHFCEISVTLFDEVLALPSGGSLADYAAIKSLALPTEGFDCTTPSNGTRVAQVKPRP